MALAVKSSVRDVLTSDRWSFSEGKTEVGPFILRYRTPGLGPDGVEGYSRVLRVIWPYGSEDTGAMPSADDSNVMGEFEDRFCVALENDGHGFLAAVLTHDGARQWIFYTSDVAECGRRLEAMPQNAERYPIELDAFDDPTWQYLRHELLGYPKLDA